MSRFEITEPPLDAAEIVDALRQLGTLRTVEPSSDFDRPFEK